MHSCGGEDQEGRTGPKKTVPVKFSTAGLRTPAPSGWSTTPLRQRSDASAASTSGSHDQDVIAPGQGSPHASPDWEQEPEDPIDLTQSRVPHEENDSDSDVYPDRHGYMKAMIANQVQAAMAGAGHSYGAFQRELDEHRREQNHRMASLELQQRTLNAGECPLVDFLIFQSTYMMI